MFPMTITLNNAAQLNAVLAAIGHEAPAPQVAVKAESPKPQATTAKKQEAPATTQPTAEAVVADVPSKKADDSAPAGNAQTADKQQTKTTEAAAPTYEDAKKAVLTVSAKLGRAAAEKLLSKFQASKLPDIQPGQFADLIAAANEALGA